MYYRYLKYILKHKWHVFRAAVKLGIIWRGIMHDMSKFRPSEFIPYARRFYGKGEWNNRFHKAWIYHTRRNRHHWEYWYLPDNKALDIPMQYLKEMACDWYGAGMAIHGKNDIKDFWKMSCKVKLTGFDKKIMDSLVNKLSEL